MTLNQAIENSVKHVAFDAFLLQPPQNAAQNQLILGSFVDFDDRKSRYREGATCGPA